MRFQNWYPATRGDTRTSSWFAILPVTIGKATRWLERVTVRWRYQDRQRFLPPCLPEPYWVMQAFVDGDDFGAD